MGFFIQNLHRETERVYSKTQYTTKMMVYRGQGMPNIDFKKMHEMKGGLLSFNNFLSTSMDRDISCCFAGSAGCNPDLTGVLFHMEIDPSMNNISYFQDSMDEILFSTHTVFRIGEIESIGD
jgi:hypothetical protein